MPQEIDPSKTSRIIGQLKQKIDDLPPRLKIAAKYIVDNPADFGLDPIRVTASKTHISANSFVRLAQYMGFENFEEFRKPFRAALVTDREQEFGQEWLSQQATHGDVGKLQAQAAQNAMNIVSRSLRLTTTDKVQRAIETLVSAKRCYVTATRSSYALAYYFHYVGRMALPQLNLIPRHMGSAVDEMIRIGPGDCLMAITLAPYSADTISALRFAKSRGASLILMADSEIIAPGVDPNIMLSVASNSPHQFGCYAGAMSVLDCLLSHLIATGGEDARARIADYEAIREDTGAYWKDPKPPRIRRS